MRDGGRTLFGITDGTVPVPRGDDGAAAMGTSATPRVPTSTRPVRAALHRLAGASALALCLAAWPAGAFARAGEAALPPAHDTTPVTSDAGMGTAEAAPSAPVASRAASTPATVAPPVPADVRSAPAEILAPGPAHAVATRGGTDAAGDGPDALDALIRATVHSPGAPASRPTPAARGGTDAAGDGDPAPAQPGAAPSGPRLATVSPAGAPADVARPEVSEVRPPMDAAPADIAPAIPAPAGSGGRPAAPAMAQEPPGGPLAPIAAEIGGLTALPPGAQAKPGSEQEALAAFYGGRQNLPVFMAEAGYTARGAAVLHRLSAAAEDGLDPEDYAVTKPAGPATPASQARAELDLARAALAYARDAQAGRFNPGRISPLVTPTREIPAPLSVLEALAGAPEADAALAAYNPPHAGYRMLKAKLAEAAGQSAPVIVAVPPGPLLRPGTSDPRVPALRTRLGLSGAADDLVYDPALAAAVKAFQEASGADPDGVVGNATLAVLNRGASEGGGRLSADIIANMERWRWLPRDLGERRVMVNIPEYMVRIHDGATLAFETRIVVGKPETPTPLLSHEMEYVVVNPAWNIPPSIAQKEMMPLLRSNPGALARMGIEAKRNRDGSYSFRQPPGERNALGRIKFMFPNDHAVYLHDTPSRALFANARRAYSHGCMRVEDPLRFGEVVFRFGLPGEGWTEQRIGKLLGGSERYITLKQRLPVHVTYFTTVVDPAGKLRVLEDIYGINAQVKALLGLAGQRRLADGTTTRKR